MKQILAPVGALVASTAALGSLATSRGLASRWYRRLDLPAIQPPGPVFPIVWTALYADIAITSALTERAFEQAGQPEHAIAYRTALVGNLALNAGWCWIFFGAKQPLLGTAAAAALAVSSADLARQAGAADPLHAKLLAPYAAWCAFATVLTGAIWWRNRS